MADIDKIDLILESINEIKGTLKEMNGRQRDTEQTVTAHGIKIDHLEKRPSGLKLIMWSTSVFAAINGVYVAILKWGGS